MLYLNEADLRKIGIDWKQNIQVAKEVVLCLAKKDFAQPIKPYLRFGDHKNRIIAMPAFVGNSFNVAGIKWIASFPENIHKRIPRAHSVVILNSADTGEPIAIINTPLLSIIRTASVSGLMIHYFNQRKELKKFNLGIIGWGPIGQYHLKMCNDLYRDKIENVFLYDIRPIDKDSIDSSIRAKTKITESWQDVYLNSDIFITCTVSEFRYIDKKPKEGALLLNVSLRDFQKGVYSYVKDTIIVDDWDEVCRENTDIEMMFKEMGLKQENTKSIIDVVCNNYLQTVSLKKPIMFNPMGMGVFDIAFGDYYFKKAMENSVGIDLK